MLLSLASMKIISWNVRGVNALEKKTQIKQQLDACGADIVVLQETKTLESTYRLLIQKWRSWKFAHSLAQGASGGLITLWNPKSVAVEPIQNEKNWQLLKVKHFDLQFWLVNVYAPIATGDKK